MEHRLLIVFGDGWVEARCTCGRWVADPAPLGPAVLLGHLFEAVRAAHRSHAAAGQPDEPSAGG
jgi:hypothetical protein